MKITNDRFIRRQIPNMNLLPQKIFKRLYDNGDIYKVNMRACTVRPVSLLTDTRLLTESVLIAAEK